MQTTPLKTTIRSVLAAAAAAGIALTASACGSATPEGSAAEESVVADDTGADDTAAEGAGSREDAAEADGASGGDSDGAASSAGGEKTEVQIGETIEDPDMGDTLEVLSAVRDFPSEEEADLIADGGEVVLLEVSVSPGEEYGGLVSMNNFKISWDDGVDFWGSKTRMIEDELDDAGYPVFEDVSRRDGGEHTGWMAFLVDERADTYRVNYERRGAEVIGSDDVIDPFEDQFEIPGS